jgi:phosphatidylglycerophosphate synthase
MPEQIDAPLSTVEATYKAREVEGIVDLYFYRKIGFLLAQFFAGLKMRPAAVTLLGGVFGIAAGHLYYYRDLRVNLLGMVLHVIANALDNADGQLARLLNQNSRSGRLIDSVVDQVIWIGIYLHLALRYLAQGGSSWVWLLAVAAGLSHALQAAAADYCRNGYLYFVKGRSGTDLDTSSALRQDYRRLSWRAETWKKLLLLMYTNITRQQEILSPDLRRLHERVERDFPHEIPAWLQSRYRNNARPTLKWWGLLMTNTRMFFLFVLFLMGKPVWFFWIELTVFNVLLTYLVLQQKEMSRSLLEFLEPRHQVV